MKLLNSCHIHNLQWLASALWFWCSAT